MMVLSSVLIIKLVAYQDTVYVIAEPYYQGTGEDKVISLTINVDWGEEYLPDILKVMDKYNIKATFFLTGRWANNNPELAKTIFEAGHEIGNHAYSHKSPNQLSYEENMEEIKNTSDAIKKAIGQKESPLYAPPSGERKDHVLKAAKDLGYTTILWSIDTIDWKRPSSDVIINRVLKKAHPGGIILAHPTNPTLEALPSIIQSLEEQGYVFVTVSENLSLESKYNINSLIPDDDNDTNNIDQESGTD